MNIFQQSVKKDRARNQFDMSYGKKMTGKFGALMPFYVEETLPGDRVQINSDIFTEFAPLLSNLKHQIDVHVDYFYVTYDSIWANWRDFISGGENYDQNPTLPYVVMNEANKADFKTGELADYFAIPVWDANGATPTISGTRNLNGLWFRGYQHVYNEWYRDQDLISKIDIERNSDGLCGAQMHQLRYASWDNDLFSSARPTAQKGNPINFLGSKFFLKREDGSPGVTEAANLSQVGAPETGALKLTGATNGEVILRGSTVQDLRKAEALQAFVEKMQAGGNRYNEYLNSMWGVDDQDQRLLIPQLLYSQDFPVKVSEVLTTSNNDNTTTDNNTAGQAYGRAVSYQDRAGFEYTCPDYGMIIGILKYSPKPAYFQGLHERWDRTDRFEWYTDHLAQIGEEPIYHGELYFQVTDPDNAQHDVQWGYHHRYYSFKTRYDEVCGDFRYGLKHQHLGRELNAHPNLNQNFIEIGNTFDSGLTRIFNVIDPALDYIWIEVYNDALYNRDVSYVSVPLP